MNYIDTREQYPAPIEPAQRRKFVVLPNALGYMDQAASVVNSPAPPKLMDVAIVPEQPVESALAAVAELDVEQAAQIAKELAVSAAEGLQDVSAAA